MMSRVATFAAAALLTGGATAHAQNPPRDATRRPTVAPLSIAGRVLDADTHLPLRRAIVRLTSGSLPKPRATRTTADGQYVFTDLPGSGAFVVTASKPLYLQLEYGQRRPYEPGRPIVLSGKSVTNADCSLPRAAAISGAVLGSTGEPLDQMWVFAYRRVFTGGRPALRSAARAVTNDIGEYRLSGLPPGDYYIAARERSAPAEFTDEPSGFATTFYPGTVDERGAQPIRLALGQQVVNLDVPVLLVKTATLSGEVIDTNGKPARYSTRVTLLDSTASGTGGNIAGAALIHPDGTFQLKGVRPGTYSLMARHPQQGEGVLPIEVGSSDVTGLQVVMGRGGSITGRIVSSRGDPLPFPVSKVEVSATTSLDPWQVTGSARATLKPDATVLWSGLTGSRLIRATKLPEGWWLKSVLRGKEDVTDAPIAVNHGDAIDGIVVVLDDKPTDLSGGARNARGSAVRNYTAIVFAEDAARWSAESRYVRAARPDQNGQYRITGLPPGPYLAIALDYVEQGQWLDPEYLETLRPAASKVALEPGGRTTLDLVVAPEPGRER